MEKVTLYVEKSEPYCLFLDFVDMEEFISFKNLCSVQPMIGNEDCSMLCISNISGRVKRALSYGTTFQVDVNALAKLNWRPSKMGTVRYELDGRNESLASILPMKKTK